MSMVIFFKILLNIILPNLALNCFLELKDLSLLSNAIHPPRVSCSMNKKHPSLLTSDERNTSTPN